MLAAWVAAGLLFAGSAYEDALALYKQRRYPEAAQAFTEALSGQDMSDPAAREAILLAGHSYFLAGQAAKAAPWLEKAAAAGVHNSELDYMLGTTYVLTRAPEKAVTAFARLFGVKADSAAAQLVTAQMFVRHELLEFAEARAKRALELDQHLAEAHYLLGIVAMGRRDIDRAVEEFRTEIALNPNYAMAYYKAGDAYAQQ